MSSDIIINSNGTSNFLGYGHGLLQEQDSGLQDGNYSDADSDLCMDAADVSLIELSPTRRQCRESWASAVQSAFNSLSEFCQLETELLNDKSSVHESQIQRVAGRDVVKKLSMSPSSDSTILQDDSSNNRFEKKQPLSKEDAETEVSTLSHVSSPIDEEPSQSELVKKLFPLANNKLASTSKQQSRSLTVNEKGELERLAYRVKELELSEESLCNQNSKLKQESSALKSKYAKFESERAAFETYRSEQMKRLQAQHSENEKALKREKLAWEKQKKAASILPTKKDRQEIEILKAHHLEQLKTWKEKETRMLQRQERLSKRVDDLTKRNAELLEEIKVLERERARFASMDYDRRTAPVQAASNIDLLFAQHSNDQSNKRVPLVNSGLHIGTINASRKPSSRKLTTVKRSQPFAGNNKSDPVVINYCTSPSQVKPKATQSGSIDQSVRDLDALEEMLGFDKCVKEKRHVDGKHERFYVAGAKLSWYVNGTMKMMNDSVQVVYFNNGDYKTIYPDGVVEYWYDESRTLHTTETDGLEIYQFDNGQVEKRYPSGTLEVIFPDKTHKYILESGEQQIVFPDGRVHHQQPI